MRFTKCRMSAADTPLQNLIKITKVRKESNCEIGDLLRRRLCLQQPAPACGLTRDYVTMLSDSQGCELPASFSFYSCVTMVGNPAFTVHATAHAFTAAINLNNMLLRQHI